MGLVWKLSRSIGSQQSHARIPGGGASLQQLQILVLTIYFCYFQKCFHHCQALRLFAVTTQSLSAWFE